MADVKINQNYEEFSKIYKCSEPFVSFQNSHLTYAICVAELQNFDNNSSRKSFFVKKITPNIQNLPFFETFLDKMLELQNNTETPCLLRLCSVFKHDSSYFLVQRNHEQSLSRIADLREIEILNILKDIVKFYSQIKEEEIFPLLLSNQFPLEPLNSDLVFYYRSLSKKKNLTRFKVKIDLLSFFANENLVKIEAEEFHLKEFQKLCFELLEKIKGGLGICSRSLLRKMKEKYRWNNLFFHPLFNVEITNQPDFKFWAIDKDKIMRKEKNAIKIVINEEEKKIENYEINSQKSKNNDKTQKSQKFNVLTMKNDEVSPINKGNGSKKSEENMDLEIKVK